MRLGCSGRFKTVRPKREPVSMLDEASLLQQGECERPFLLSPDLCPGWYALGGGSGGGEGKRGGGEAGGGEAGGEGRQGEGRRWWGRGGRGRAPVVGEGNRVGGSNVALAAWLDFDKHPFYSMDEESGFEFRAEGRGVVSRGPGSDF